MNDSRPLKHLKHNRRGLAAALSLACLLTAPSWAATESLPQGKPDYPAFKIINEKNIFNSNRSSRSAKAGKEVKPVKVETFALVGTMSYTKGNFAFFDSSSSAFKKAVKEGESIAGFTLVEITSNKVRLKADEKEMELTIGTQLRREDEGEWKASRQTESFTSSSSSPSESSSSSSKDTSSSPSSGEESDVIKRLMKKREQELKK